MTDAARGLEAVAADTPYAPADVALAVVSLAAALASPLAQVCARFFFEASPWAITLGTPATVLLPAVWAAAFPLAVGLSLLRHARAAAFAVSTFLLAALVSFATATLLY